MYDAPGLLPTISTIAPRGSQKFFERLLHIKQKIYRERFQLQFSIHTTDARLRDWMIPAKKWSLGEIAEYGGEFYRKGERKITLNFALAEGMPVDGDLLLRHFDPDIFLVKITPVNPTCSARKHGISSQVIADMERYEIVETLRAAGYEVILSIGELAENHIGSNCGQHITNYLNKREAVQGGYTYPLRKV